MLLQCSRNSKDSKGLFFLLLSEQNRISNTYWTMQNSKTDADLQSIIFQNGKYYAVGKKGTLLTSSDSKEWTRISLNTENSINRISYTAGKFFILGENGLIILSSDGDTWKNVSLITSHNLKSVTTDGSVIVLGGLNPLGKSVILASKTPETRTSWVETASTSYSNSIDIAFYLNGKFSMWGSTGVYSSCTTDCYTSSGWPGFLRDLTLMKNNAAFDQYVQFKGTVYLSSSASGKIYSTANFTDIKEVSGFPSGGSFIFSESERFSYLGTSLFYSNDLTAWKENTKAVNLNFRPSSYIINDNIITGIGTGGKIGTLDTGTALP